MSRPEDVERSSFKELHQEVTLNAIQLDMLTDDLKAAQTPAFVESCNLPPEALEKINGFVYYMRGGNPKLLVPEKFRDEVVRIHHSLGHFGQARTFSSIALHYYWRGMRRQITDFIQRCQKCQLNKKIRVEKRPPFRFPKSERLRTVHLDLVGPLQPSSKNNCYLLTMMDRTTRWLEAIPMASITANDCAEMFFKHWVARFGVPDIIITDQGPQFEAHMFRVVLHRLGIQRRRTTAYHPATNGLLERVHAGS